MAIYPALGHMASAFMSALGSPLIYSTATIDQLGLIIADALHGRWGGGRSRVSDADALLLVGGNPVISKQYLSQNPAQRLKDLVKRGAKLIVIEPRKTESARRAHVHLQVRPGEDAADLTGILRILISRNALDHEFVEDNVEGLDSLTAAVEPFTPEYVAERAGLNIADLIEAATILGSSRRCFLGGGTGIGMSGHGNLRFYLLLCIQSLRGFWREPGRNTMTRPCCARQWTLKHRPTVHRVRFSTKLRVSGTCGCRSPGCAPALCWMRY